MNVNCPYCQRVIALTQEQMRQAQVNPDHSCTCRGCKGGFSLNILTKAHSTEDGNILCLHCFSTFYGNVAVGEQVCCTECRKCFNVSKYLGDLTMLRTSVLGDMASMFGWHKCPECNSCTATMIGSDKPMKGIIDGRWCKIWCDYYLCDKCHSSWRRVSSG